MQIIYKCFWPIAVSETDGRGERCKITLVLRWTFNDHFGCCARTLMKAREETHVMCLDSGIVTGGR